METREVKAIRTIRWSVLANLLLAIVKWIAGFFGNSYALIADAIESTTDVFASLLVLFGLRYSTRPADDDHPYGHGKAEPLVTFIVVVILLLSAALIAYHSIQNIRTPHASPAPFTLIVLGVIIVFKEVSYRYVAKRGEETGSTSLVADAWHHRSDAITSLMAFLGISVALIMGPGYEAADDWAALFASGFITYNAFLIFRPALGEIMDEHTHDELIAEIRAVASKVTGVLDTEKCFVRKTGMYFHVDLHLVVDGGITVHEGHHIAHELKERLLKDLPEIADVLIHVEPNT